MVISSGMAAAVTAAPPISHQTSAPMSLMSCVRESSPPLQDLDSSTEQEIDKNETSKKRRFHPFRGLRKMFRRKVRHSSVGAVGSTGTGGGGLSGDEFNIHGGLDTTTPEPETPNMDSHRSRSTSELLAGDEPTRRKSGTGGLYSGHHGGLSVSHDSVFTGDPLSGSDLELDTAQSSSSLSIQQLVLPGVRAELLDAVRRRRGREDTSEDDEDLGLPRSPCNSPTTADILLEKSVKDHTTKSHSTCSDGSLLSMGSSEMDEDSFGLHSRHSSKVSLHEKKTSPSIGLDLESELDLGDSGSLSAPLSHSAARHKMAVRPKRTHGAPRRRRVQQLTTGTALPTTPEVNEETLRSVTPEVTKQALSTAIAQQKYLSRSRSNATTTTVQEHPIDQTQILRSTSHDLELERFEDDDQKTIEKKQREESSFFGRLLSRRSGKKKKEKIEEISTKQTTSTTIFNVSNVKKRMDEKGRYVENNYVSHKLHKSGPSARQRIEPIDIPPSPEFHHKTPKLPPSSPSARLVHCDIVDATTKISTSPPKITPKPFITATTLAKMDETPRSNPFENVQFRQKRMDAYIMEGPPENITKIDLTENFLIEKTDHGFASLNLLQQDDPGLSRPILKSHSFKHHTSKHRHSKEFLIQTTNNKFLIDQTQKFIESEKDYNQLRKFEIKKSSSLDSIKSVSPIESRPMTIGCIKDAVSASINDNASVKTSSLSVTTVSCNNNDKSITNEERAFEKTNMKSVTTLSSNSDKRNVKTSSLSVTTVTLNESSNKSASNIENHNFKTSITTVSCNDNEMNDNNTAKIQIKRSSNEKTNVPEFLKIQLNKVDTKPTTNVVLTANLSSKKDEINKNLTDVNKKDERITDVNKTVDVNKMSETNKMVDTNKMTDINKMDLNRKEVRQKLTDKLTDKTPDTNKMVENKKVTDVSKMVEINKMTDVNKMVEINKMTDVKQMMEINKMTDVNKMVDLNRKEVRRNSTMNEINNEINSETNLKKLRRNIMNDMEDELYKSEPTTPTETTHHTSTNLYKRQSTTAVSTTTPSSPIITKPIIVKKSSSLELIETTKREQVPKKNHSDTLERKNSETQVILRKKPTLPTKKQNEEPELMKVFARRSLKLNGDGDNSALGQQVLVMLDNIDKSETNESIKSRDSDKENEEESTVDMKKDLLIIDTNMASSCCTVNNMRLSFNNPSNRFITKKTNNNDCNEHNNKIENNKMASWKKENIEIELKPQEDFIPMFKRIQQRKEEWEQRAQQAMKKTIP
ncbi:uncharacterized protein LOC123299242 isoform X2 [Chrysoperla carnea]|uniref:uncharacterized protein LOC123299242 isoform X2 n=1 Tax=Chrysoperla carnea TaxID=189513 RepID=UPI001D064816|nr:uncharacterized protein LOC123299242 isoform X2 [Chrysoperla carnea]